MQKPNETQEEYFSRLQQKQAARLAKGSIAGNHVLIDHGRNEYSLSAHLQPGSVGVDKGMS
jgi:murein DD-endopeptidase MepM/ murein hydrolase activator NlpD